MSLCKSNSTVADPWQVESVILTAVCQESPGVATYQFQPTAAAAVAGNAVVNPRSQPAQPGQFNMLYLPGIGEAAISISGLQSTSGVIVHTIRSVGSVTGAIGSLPLGTTLGMRGPFGSVWPLDRCVGRDVVLMGGGIGLAPLRPVVQEIMRRRDAFGSVHLLIGARTPQDLLYQNEYSTWQAAGIDVETTVDRAGTNWSGQIGVATLLLERLQLTRPQQTALLTCGPEVMMLYAIRTALARGLSSHHIWLSLERSMNCAVGTCGHCQFGPHFICKDGPVLRYDQVEPFMEVADL